eukprot:TRINITY_DN657_c0_g4_i1.p1 TRINITY_DN657_c0_g4~~TRINITY_DN657_c0_g4_i1.p1  ORF type:complete len:281 (-),score=43.80 TRINITY_DN657_c0_g4_i1:44-886(-)
MCIRDRYQRRVHGNNFMGNSGSKNESSTFGLCCRNKQEERYEFLSGHGIKKTEKCQLIHVNKQKNSIKRKELIFNSVDRKNGSMKDNDLNHPAEIILKEEPSTDTDLIPDELQISSFDECPSLIRRNTVVIPYCLEDTKQNTRIQSRASITIPPAKLLPRGRQTETFLSRRAKITKLELFNLVKAEVSEKITINPVASLSCTNNDYTGTKESLSKVMNEAKCEKPEAKFFSDHGLNNYPDMQNCEQIIEDEISSQRTKLMEDTTRQEILLLYFDLSLIHI